MLGFIMRTTQNFDNRKCIDLLYNTLVRSQLEYLTPIWSPYQQTYIDKIERVQKKYTRYIYFRCGIQYEPYEGRLSNLKYLSLRYRRIYFDMCLLHRIIHNDCLGPLSDKLTFRGTLYPNRNNNLFNPNTSRTNYGLHVDITNRLQLTYNQFFTAIDLLNTGYDRFRELILETLFELP